MKRERRDFREGDRLLKVSLIKGGVSMAIDPVCKMEVEESKAAATSEYKDKKYYFCSGACKQAFDQAPEKYLAEEKK